MGIDYLKELQDYIGFQCSTVKIYTKEQVGFSEFMDRMYACAVGNRTVQSDSIYSCELATGEWSQTEDRYKKGNFLVPFIHDSISTVTRLENTNRTTGGAVFLSAFSAGVWLAVLGLTVAFVTLKLADPRFAPIHSVPRDNFSSVLHKPGFRLKQRINRVDSAV